ncbi:hypothetical protein BZA70DRAFT_281920 [Myxozyma melibiosi]|uniref:DUF2423 domain-containing protein n=1 Tax=Myxozyma melibiosi TaxID=54550 RepID=A0ABR1F1K2_9ASCO
MAKSLRAKSRVRARGIRRATVFDPVTDARTIRLSKKLNGDSSATTTTAASSATTESETSEEASASMDVDDSSASTASTSTAAAAATDAPKVSTSGWKGSRNEQWKQKKASKIYSKKKQGSKSLVFGSVNKKKSAKK